MPKDRFAATHRRQQLAKDQPGWEQDRAAERPFKVRHPGLSCTACRCSIDVGVDAVLVVVDGRKTYRHHDYDVCFLARRNRRSKS